MLMMTIMIVGIIFAAQGVSKHNDVNELEETFHAQQEDYIVNNTKADRDSAEVGSVLSEQHAEILNTPSELIKLKLVGVGNILTGIFVILFGIMTALIMMPFKLAKVITKNQAEQQNS